MIKHPCHQLFSFGVYDLYEFFQTQSIGSLTMDSLVYMKLQRLLSYTRKAVDDYNMIEAGDKIAIGISGGKDSLALLYALHGLKRFYPVPFEIHAICIHLGLEPFDLTQVSKLCENINIPFTVIDTQIAEIVFESRYYCFPPVTYMGRKKLYSIRPLLYAPEADIRAFSRKYDLPVVKSPCPVDGSTKREYMKNLIKEQSKAFPGLPERLFNGLQRSEVPGWRLEAPTKYLDLTQMDD